MRLVWRAKARRDVEAIVEYLAERNPSAADRMEALIDRTVETLVGRPLLYRPGRMPDTREAVIHRNYIVIYRVGDGVVTILTIIHARQCYP
ncbi:type II toxin-antitoxin system RelE/ParE family toxin [Sphingomonas sp. PAMC 26617]|uniref:type II toxin-antitoxin system RelE/ParE family toxin n=1 Tax=Sphingomonas sp. PAMC 26617 TaxID=1112216 RepID=UPI00028832DC|nr:type II toxin-antitoxin system RelE/ParE family toxin [Sphingomonas sp. PAMC 26617]